MKPSDTISRRQFVQQAVAASFTVAAITRGEPLPAARKNIKLGMDNFAVRGMGWKAGALIEHAASLRLDSLFITDLDAFESFDEPYLKDLRSKAADKGLQIQVGTWSICPTSVRFKNKWGTAEEHLALGIRVAKAVGSPVIRVILGGADDRKGEGGIERHIESTAKVCKACRSRALDVGVKIAVENHAGDMHSRELVHLIELAGRDYVGANIDSGNAVWTLEDPLANLENLGPYVFTSSLRDSAIWEYEDGARVQWTAFGDGGQVDWQTYFKRWAELCPNAPVHIETISGFNRDLPFLKPEFWPPYANMRADDFARWLALARRGKPRDPWKPPAGKDKKLAEQEHQRAELERSIRYCKQTLGLGLKA